MLSSRRDILASAVALLAGSSLMVPSDEAQAQVQGSLKGKPPPLLPTILVFGDSNTWGYVPQLQAGATRFTRYDPSVRWPMVLAESAKERFRIVEYGISGLVGGLSSGEEELEDGSSRAAIDQIRNIVAANWPIDQLVVMLGTNDLGISSLSEPEVIAPLVAATVLEGLKAHRRIGGNDPVVTLVSPIPFGSSALALGIPPEVLVRSRGLAPALAEQANQHGWRFLDAAAAGELDTIDGIHWSAAHHLRFAEMLFQAVLS